MSPARMRVAKVRSEEDLHRALEQLGEPANGLTRVFRGQARRYKDTANDSVLASLHRPSATVISEQWIALTQQAAFVSVQAGSPDESELQRVWIPALLQHYGPGSHYVDVTGSLDIALWFATYRFRTQASTENLYFGQSVSPVTFHWAWYEPVEIAQSGDPGPILYVFDVPTWRGFGTPAHGDLVAVRHLPQGQRLIHRATRLQRQDAYLLYAAPGSPFGPNLGHLPRAAFTLASGFKMLERVREMDTQDVFPPPAEDPCYSVLLSTPLTRLQHPEVYSHPLGLNCYVTRLPPSRSQFDEFAIRFYAKED